MVVGDNLTNLQRVALRGEVAYAVSTAVHDSDIKYRIYAILKDIEEENKPFLVEAFKEAVTFDENIVDKLYLETLTNKVPVWLWVEKAMADMKEALRLTEVTSMSRTSVNKSEERKKIIESAFVNFARKALMISPDASEQLFDEILNDYDLSFLHTSCFYLKSSCEEMRNSGKVEDHISEDLMDCHFDIRDMLNFRVESEALKLLNEEKSNYKIKKKPERVIKVESVDITPDMTEAEILELINKKIFSVFKGLVNEEPKQQKFKYVVNKVFNDTQISTVIRVCNTREEAEKFIEKIKKEYPELQSTCDFFISREKERWETKKTTAD